MGCQDLSTSLAPTDFPQAGIAIVACRRSNSGQYPRAQRRRCCFRGEDLAGLGLARKLQREGYRVSKDIVAVLRDGSSRKPDFDGEVILAGLRGDIGLLAGPCCNRSVRRTE